MNPSQHAEQFQSQLANYVPQFTPEFWPVWLIIAGVLLVGMWLVLGLLCLYPQAVGDVFPGVRYWLLQAHFALAFISLFFIFGHLYLCTTGRTPHETFKSMVDGYHRH